MIPLWWVSLSLEAALLWLLLRRDDLPWFTVWMGLHFLCSAVEMLTRHVGWFYDPFWRVSETVLLILLCLAAAEAIRYLDLASLQYPLLLAIGATGVIHIALRRTFLWPDSYLEVVIAVIAMTQLLIGLVMSQGLARSHGRHRIHAALLTFYTLSTAACYYAQSAFPKTIGLAIIGVEVLTVVGWVWVALREPTPRRNS